MHVEFFCNNLIYLIPFKSDKFVYILLRFLIVYVITCYDLANIFQNCLFIIIIIIICLY